jgi:hypothetical protein
VKLRNRLRTNLLLYSLIALLLSFPCLGQQNSGAAKAGDGQHDFDFEIGPWKTHLKRLAHPLTGSTAWLECDGTSVVRKVWGGKANFVELEADCPSSHIEALSLRLYNPQSHQWSLNFANSKDGILGVPTIGVFKSGRGEFYDQETFNGQAVLVRFVISNINANSCRFEQAFSEDGGKSWETNWIANDTRVADESAQQVSESPAETAHDGQHDFDFEVGSWKIHLSRLKDRLAGSKEWVAFDGTSVTKKAWNGRADLEEFETDSQTGHIEGLTLRLYNPQSHQWRLYWANSADGVLDTPMTGEFKNGVGEFFDQQLWKGRAVFVRFIWSNTTTSTPHFEQSFSDDGGKTWEVNWITNQTRVNDETNKTQ